VLNNRSRVLDVAVGGRHNRDARFDVVIGPIADDDIALLFRQFENGLIGLDELARGLEYKELSVQHSFHTARALTALEFLEVSHGEE
jgi:hypothetical protein